MSFTLLKSSIITGGFVKIIGFPGTWHSDHHSGLAFQECLFRRNAMCTRSLSLVIVSDGQTRFWRNERHFWNHSTEPVLLSRLLALFCAIEAGVLVCNGFAAPI